MDDNGRDVVKNWSADQWRRLMLLRKHGRWRRLHCLPALVSAKRKRAKVALIADHGICD